MTLTMNAPLKLWFVVLSAVAMFGCSNCQGTCKQNIPYPEPGSCPLEGAPQGSPGGKCPSWPGNCDDGLHCTSGTCLPCGGANEACCFTSDECSVGVCDLENDGEDICRTDCGSAGQDCCEHNVCASGLTCINGASCESGPLECSGALTWYVGTFNATTRCAGIPIIVKADTQAEAAQCAGGQLPAGSAGRPPQQQANPPQQYTGCIGGSVYNPLNPFGTVTFEAFTDADAQVCLQSQCTNCEVSFGECAQN